MVGIILILFWILFITALCRADEASGQKTKEFEGFRSEIYLIAGVKHIGYGFNLEDPKIKSIIPQDIRMGQRPITKKEADRIFDLIYKDAAKDAIEYIGSDKFDRLAQPQKEILTDMAYNIGLPRLKKFKKLHAAIIDNDCRKAVIEMKDSQWYAQVKRRAKHHADNFCPSTHQ